MCFDVVLVNMNKKNYVFVKQYTKICFKVLASKKKKKEKKRKDMKRYKRPCHCLGRFHTRSSNHEGEGAS